MAIRRNNVTVICEGDTEYNYLTGLKQHIDSTLNIIPSNAEGGDYTNVLKKLKETSHSGTVARFVLVDYDRVVTVLNEDKNFNKLLEYCKNEQKKGNPTFIIVSNPDFDRFVLLHNCDYRNQDKLSFLMNKYKYKSLAEFKKDTHIFEKFNKPANRYMNVANNVKQSNLILYNMYEFNHTKYTFKKMSIIYEKDNVIYKLSNMMDLLNIL